MTVPAALLYQGLCWLLLDCFSLPLSLSHERSIRGIENLYTIRNKMVNLTRALKQTTNKKCCQKETSKLFQNMCNSMRLAYLDAKSLECCLHCLTIFKFVDERKQRKSFFYELYSGPADQPIILDMFCVVKRFLLGFTCV